MANGHFEVKSIKSLDEVKVGDVFEESDFATVSPSGKFVQLEYKEVDKEKKKYEIKPGVWTIEKTMMGFELVPTSFVSDKILEDFVHTKDVSEKIDCFFSRLHVYKKHGIEVPKRAMLIYGPPGSGKTTIISKVCRGYTADEARTAVVVWATDKYEAYEIKSFLNSFEYPNVDRLILTIEDIGGIEMDEIRMKSDSSLLSLLDNQEKTFKVPTLILATTNHPEIFLGNLTNRPGRFDDKIEVGLPTGNQRLELYKFFSQSEPEQPTKEALDLIESNSTEDFSPAHIKEIFLRADIYVKSHDEVIRDMVDEIRSFKKAFSKKRGVGGFGD